MNPKRRDILLDDRERSSRSRRFLGAFMLLAALVVLFSTDALMQVWGVFLSVGACALFAPDLAELVSGLARAVLFSGGTPLPSDLSMGKHREQLGDWEGAILAYRRYADEDPEDQRPRLRLALIYHYKLHWEDVACYWYDKVLAANRHDETQTVAFLEKAKILKSQGDIKALSELYHDMIPHFPTHPSTVAVQGFIKALESEETS